ncbi:MAG TPA: serine protease [Candidatus Methylacidiphilales bacterium]|nr:serine protease [Candidatus Methylacidiphilales bacterium]
MPVRCFIVCVLVVMTLQGAKGNPVDAGQVPPAAMVSDSSPSIPALIGISDSTPAPPDATTPPNPNTLTPTQAGAIVLIKGDNAEGTGFLTNLDGGPVVMTSLHILADNPNLHVTTRDGQSITALGLKGAQDRDLALIPIQDNNYTYLDVASDIRATAKPGDLVITPGNNGEGEVMLMTKGRLLGIKSEEIEISNRLDHGNSGGPVFHPQSGKVLGVVTEALDAGASTEMDKLLSQDRATGFTGRTRYFGLRLDNVPVWETYDWKRYQIETTFLDQFHYESRCLDSYLNPPSAGRRSMQDSGDDDDFANLYLNEPAIKQANHDYHQDIAGTDSSQKLEAWRALLVVLHNVADANMTDIENPSNFYSFDRRRARDEIDYRKQLQAELDSFEDNLNRMDSVARKND